MAIFRVSKNRNYTVMSNYHLKDRALTLKSKGLLSMMLSLPEEWDYTTRGLASICKEGVDAIGASLKELEAGGYLVRRQLGDVLAAELYGARPGAEQARDGLQCRGLARAVRAYEGHVLALVHEEGHSLYGVDGAVIDVDVLDFQYLLHAQAPFFRPR